MRIRTLVAITATMFVLPALAAQPLVPVAPPVVPAPPAFLATPLERTAGDPDIDIVYELRLLKVPAGFRAGSGLKDDVVLTDADLRRVLEALQNLRDANVMQFPKVTGFSGQEWTVRICEQQEFATTLETVKMKGQTVCVPKKKSFELGEVFTVRGRASANARTVTVHAKLVHTALVGPVELVPVVTQITPIYEGGSQGPPIQYTQFLQVPNIKTEQLEKNVAMSADTTIVLGGWKQAGDAPSQGKWLRKKEKPAVEFEVVALATVRTVRNEEPQASVAPMPREVPELVKKVFSVADLVIPNTPGLKEPEASAEYRRNLDNLVKVVTSMVRPYSWEAKSGRGQTEFFEIGCSLLFSNTADVLYEVDALIEYLRWLQEHGTTAPIEEALRRVAEGAPVAPMPQESTKPAKYKLRNIAATDAADALRTFLKGQNLTAVVTAEPVTNTLLVSAEPELQKRLLNILAGLDKAPTQIVLQATVIQVPRGFGAQSGLNVGGAPDANAWTLSPREAKMFAELIWAAKGRGECDILSRPQLLVKENQTGFVQVGEQRKAFAPATKAGDAPVEITGFMPTGLTLRLSPRMAPDGKSLLMTADAELTRAVPNGILHAVTTQPAGVSFPVTEFMHELVFEKQQMHITASVRTGDTLIFSASRLNAPSSFFGAIQTPCVADQLDTLVIVTPAVVAQQEAVRPAGWFLK